MSALTNKINISSEINTGDNTISVSALSEGLAESAASTMTYSVGSLKYSIITSGDNKGYYQCDGVDGDGIGNVEIASKIKDIAVREIAAGAFSGETKITNFTIPESVVKINAQAFFNTNITSITIPYNVKEIGDEAFRRCYALETVTFKTHSTLGGLTSLGVEVFGSCYALKDVSLPDSLTSMGARVFYHCTALEQIDIGNGLTEIPDWTFYGCEKLQTVDWGESVTVTRIGKLAFYGCTALSTHSIPQCVTWIGAEAYASSGLSTLKLDDPNGWFFTSSETVPAEIKDGETCTHISDVTPVLLTTQFADKNWFKLDQIPAPTVTIDNGVLTITDYSGLAETFKIYVNAGDPIEIPAKILPGTWVGNDSLDYGDMTTTTYANTFTYTTVLPEVGELSCNTLIFQLDIDGNPGLVCGVYHEYGDDPILHVVYQDGEWTSPDSKTIVITEVGDVSPEFEALFLANFTRVSE